MDTTTYVSLSVQNALQRQMDIIAHNIANAATGAFKSEKPIFVEVLDDNNDVAYVEDYGVARDMQAGRLEVTGGPLDVAVQGDAFLAVQVGDEVRYTRNGHLQLDAEGELSTSTGYAVLDIDQRPIEIPPGVDGITISPDGTVSGGDGPLARIGMVAFDNPLDMERAPDSLYVTAQAPVPPRDASLVQGALEMSNVSPVLQLTEMIEVLRAYQRNAELAENEHQLQLKTIDTAIQA